MATLIRCVNYKIRIVTFYCLWSYNESSSHLPDWYAVCFDKAMKTAFSVWEQRIAPVFDTSRQVYLVESDGMQLTAETAHTISGKDVSQRVEWLADQGVGTLVCGAISRPWQERLEAAGLTVIPFVAGDLANVVQAWLSGALRGSAFTMPGCCGRRRMRCGCGAGGRGRQGGGRGRAG